MTLKAQIESAAKKYLDEIIQFRRTLHANPELSFNEYKTAAFIEEQLAALKIPFHRLTSTGVIGIIKGKNTGKTIALRADMDALPLFELNDFAYKSSIEGVMHACGHDAHMASLLGAAKIINELKNEFSGQVKLIFQPAEEKSPGGAIQLIEAGVLKNPDVDLIIGQHVLPELESGKVGFRPGNFMASSDEIYITVKGKGGHAALPHQLIDPVAISAQLITALQQIVSRKTPPLIPAVLSFGKVIAQGAVNVIPDEVSIEGTFRTFDENFRTKAHELIRECCLGLVKSMGGEAVLEIRKGYPVVYNNPELTEKIAEYATQYLGKDQVLELESRMTAEDFAWYGKFVPATFYRIGVKKPNTEIVYPLHTAQFDIDEKTLVVGAGLMAYLAIKELQNE